MANVSTGILFAAIQFNPSLLIDIAPNPFREAQNNPNSEDQHIDLSCVFNFIVKLIPSLLTAIKLPTAQNNPNSEDQHTERKPPIDKVLPFQLYPLLLVITIALLPLSCPTAKNMLSSGDQHTEYQFPSGAIVAFFHVVPLLLNITR